jgi:ribosome maturation factor RimP
MREQLLGLLEPVVGGLGYELVELEFNPSAGRALLRAFIDRCDGEPVTLDDCEAVSRALESVLDAGNVIPRAYQLEVSSPGFDRPLRTQAHFERQVGNEVRLETAVPLEGRRRFRGRLLAVRAATLDVEVDGKNWAIPLGIVRKARLVA